MTFSIIILLAVTTCTQSFSTDLLLNGLADVLSSANLKDIIKGDEVHKMGATFFKYYGDNLLPLQFQVWTKYTGKNYANEEEQAKREKIWSANVKLIDEHNKLNKSYSLAINHLGDMAHEEYINYMLGTKITVAEPNLVDEPEKLEMAAKSVDWRNHGYVTSVKNQGMCGSCWAFSSTGAIEGANMRRHNKLVSLSEQNLMDCSTAYGNNGCNGGLMDFAFKYVIDNGGLDSERAYPYEAQLNECRFNRNSTAVKLSGFRDVAQGSEAALKAAIAGNGPVSIAIDAGHPSFQFYHEGVYDEPACSPSQLDHGVLAVGYGSTAAGEDYWIVKNSWSASWGVSGYVMMSRNKNNQCGVASAASYPIAV